MTQTSTFLRRTFVCALAAASGATVHAADAGPAPEWVLTGNATLVSDYIFRGISQTQHAPTLQVTLEAAHASGVYLGTFGSGVSNAAYTNGSGSEIDLYGGYRYTIDDRRNIDAGLVSYWYPRANYLAENGETIRFHTQEAKLAYNDGSVNLTGWVSLSTHWFGFVADPAQASSTRGSTYLELNWSPALSDALVLNLHVGAQRIRGLRDFDFQDVKAGVTWTRGRWVLAAAVTHNNGAASVDGRPVWTFFDADGRGTKVAGTRGVLSAAYSF